jgi:hypothetical protein
MLKNETFVKENLKFAAYNSLKRVCTLPVKAINYEP